MSFITGCSLKIANERILLNENVSFNKYEEIKKIVINQAKSNGFSELTSEVKPSKYNNWDGQLYFKVVTPSGTDQLYVEFSKKDSRIMLYMHGGGTRANPNSAIKSIQGRLDEENMYKYVTTTTVKP